MLFPLHWETGGFHAKKVCLVVQISQDKPSKKRPLEPRLAARNPCRSTGVKAASDPAKAAANWETKDAWSLQISESRPTWYKYIQQRMLGIWIHGKARGSHVKMWRFVRGQIFPLDLHLFRIYKKCNAREDLLQQQQKIEKMKPQNFSLNPKNCLLTVFSTSFVTVLAPVPTSNFQWQNASSSSPTWFDLITARPPPVDDVCGWWCTSRPPSLHTRFCWTVEVCITLR